jgi:molybdopterin synthase catalytic subunit
MDVTVEFTRDAISPPPWQIPDGCGAAVDFVGVVRPSEDGRALMAIRYEIYREMAGPVLAGMARALGERRAIHSVTVMHREGVVPAGDASVFVRACSVHRAEALAFVADFLTAMKRDAPIWKAEMLR